MMHFFWFKVEAGGLRWLGKEQITVRGFVNPCDPHGGGGKEEHLLVGTRPLTPWVLNQH
jgi:ribosomal protein L2